MYKIFYHPLSFPSLAPVFAASKMEVDYELKTVDLGAGEQGSDDYLAINPFGKVPAIKDGLFSMGESAAILRYIARQSGSPLYPDNIQDQAYVDQWMDYVNHHIRGPIARVHFNRKLAPLFGVEPDLNSLATGEKMLSANFPVIEKALSQNDYLCGAYMSLADIALIAALEPIDMSQIDISAYSAINEWRNTRRKDDFYTNVHSHYGAEMGL